MDQDPERVERVTISADADDAARRHPLTDLGAPPWMVRWAVSGDPDLVRRLIVELEKVDDGKR